MQKLLIATHNPAKVIELSKYLLPLLDQETKLVSLTDIGLEEEAKETGETIRDNAIIKAQYYGDISGLPSLADDGGFIYKQINPVARKQVIGTLVQHDGAYYVEVSGREYRILLASVTYFRINIGDQVTIIVPEENSDATWAAVEAAL